MSGDLKIESEIQLAEIPRAREGRDVLRVTLTKATSGNGKAISWIGLREFWSTDEGEMRPSKKGMTIRIHEIDGVVGALTKAKSIMSPPPRGGRGG